MALPYVIPMSGTGHTASRTWMFEMNQRLLPSGKSAPTYAGIYRLRTKPRSNPMGTWFAWDIAFEGWVTKAEFARGHALHEAFASGAQMAEAPLASVGEVADDTGAM